MPRSDWRLIAALLLFAGDGALGDQFETDPDAVVWVDVSGCRTGPEPGVPMYGSIQTAINNAPIDTPSRIEVRCGTWMENIDLLGKPIVLYAIDGPSVTTIQGLGGDAAVRCVSGESAETAIIGFFITGGGGPGSLGGGIEIDGASPSIIGCKVEQNDALLGGGIYVRNGDPLLLNNTIYGNEATSFGAGIFLEDANPEIVNCSIAANICFEAGGGVRAFAESDPIITNTILWGNTPDEVSPDGSSFPELYDCIVDGGWFGFGANNSAADPEFLDLTTGDLRISDTSPAIDSADAGALPADDYDLDLDGDTVEETPLDGFLRLRRWDGPPAASFPPPLDRGAHEWNDYDSAGDDEPIRRSELGYELWAYSEEGDTLFLPYSSTHDLFTEADDVRRVVIVVPSSGRGVNFSVRSITDPAIAEGLDNETLVISPQYLENQDIALGGFGFQTADILYWSSGWNRAARSANGAGDGPEPPYGTFGARPFRAPSFRVLDDIITHIVQSGNFERLEQIVLTGHSSGGQFTNRFALSSPIEDTVVRHGGIDFRYVPTSPGTFASVSPLRPVDPSVTDLRLARRPDVWVPTPCADEEFDDWPWGISGGFFEYHEALLGEGATDEEIGAFMRAQYERREVTILIDACDNDPEHEQLPAACPDLLLGDDRYERAQNFFACVVATYGPQVLSRQRIAIIDDGNCAPPGSGGLHSSRRNYSSRMGKRWILDVDSDPPPAEHTGRRIVRVDVDQTGLADGMSWAMAFGDLQDGCLSAAAWGGDVTQVWVAEGTYRPDRGTGQRQDSFPIMRGIATLGGFASGETFDYERAPEAHLCVLSGDLLGDSPGSIGDDAYHVVTGHLVDGHDPIPTLELDDPVGDDPQVFRDFTGALDGFTIRYGNASLQGDPPFTFSSLDPFTRGGGVYALRSSPLVQDCIIEYCHAWNGGGVASLGCIPSDPLFPCIASVYEGIRVWDCDIRDNSALLTGGGLNAKDSSPIVVRTRIRNNVAENGGGGVGTFGVVLHELPLLEACAITGNDGGPLGGALMIQTDGIVVSNCLLRDNAADEDGGAIYATLQKTSEAWFTNLTVVDNTVDAGGRGSAFYGAGSGLAFIDNCVLAGNGGSVDEIEGFSFVSYTRADRQYTGPGNIDEDAQFVDAPGNDFRLAPGSPCIDAASSPTVQNDGADLDRDDDRIEPVPFDLDSAPRFRDDVGSPDTGIPGEGFPEVVDMGAYEFQESSCVADLDGDGVVGVSDLLGVLGNWGGPGGDVTGDGTTDVADLLTVLASWGSC